MLRFAGSRISDLNGTAFGPCASQTLAAYAAGVSKTEAQNRVLPQSIDPQKLAVLGLASITSTARLTLAPATILSHYKNIQETT